VGYFLGVSPIMIGILAALIALSYFLLEHIVRLRKRLAPRLLIQYDDATQDCHKTVRFSDDNGKTFSEGRGIRMRVECSTNVDVEQCAGYLTRIEYRMHGGKFSDLPLYEPVRLDWALEKPSHPVTVYPGITRYLGVCSSDERYGGFRLTTQSRSFATPERFGDAGEYLAHITIVGARCPPLSRRMLISWNGKWNEIRACLVQNSSA
jgi:hypothetical protein